jgi:hypothetical protein
MENKERRTEQSGREKQFYFAVNIIAHRMIAIIFHSIDVQIKFLPLHRSHNALQKEEKRKEQQKGFIMSIRLEQQQREREREEKFRDNGIFLCRHSDA